MSIISHSIAPRANVSYVAKLARSSSFMSLCLHRGISTHGAFSKWTCLRKGIVEQFLFSLFFPPLRKNPVQKKKNFSQEPLYYSTFFFICDQWYMLSNCSNAQGVQWLKNNFHRSMENHETLHLVFSPYAYPLKSTKQHMDHCRGILQPSFSISKQIKIAILTNIWHH